MATPRYVVVADLRYGRNGTDPPLSLPQTACVEALNVDWYDGLLGRKRNGADTVSLSGGTSFSSGIQTVLRFLPTGLDAAAELWAIDGAATPIVKRLAAGTTWANVTVADAIATAPAAVQGAVLNGKLFLAYDSTQDRLHVYDPGLASPQVRRVGLAASSPPTAADTGGGAYAATLRYYKQDTIQLTGSTIVRRSELSAKVSFTPSGAGASARVTRGAFPSESETHWRVWGSTDDTTYYNISGNIAVGTTTYDDSATPSGYSTNTAQDPTGTYTLPTSGKYLISDGNRLLWAGAWESGGLSSRVWFTPVLGSSDQGDDERYVYTTLQRNWVSVNEQDGGAITGMMTMQGVPYVFKYRQHYKFVPTGDVSVPYLPRRRSTAIGCIAPKTLIEAEDEAGRPALYFLSHKGPYRIAAAGLQYLGRDNEDIWRTVNQAATTVVAHAVYHADKHQVWIWIATGSSTDPDTKMVFDTLLGRPDDQGRVRGGWSKHTGDTAGARCAVMFANTLAASMSFDLKPYVGRATGTTILKTDSTATDDAGTTFQAYVKTAPITPGSSLGYNLTVSEASLIAIAASGVTITQTIDRDFGLETQTASVSLTAAASESRVYRKIEAGTLAGAGIIQLQWGDSAAVSNAWTLDAVVAPVAPHDAR